MEIKINQIGKAFTVIGAIANIIMLGFVTRKPMDAHKKEKYLQKTDNLIEKYKREIESYKKNKEYYEIGIEHNKKQIEHNKKWIDFLTFLCSELEKLKEKIQSNG